MNSYIKPVLLSALFTSISPLSAAQTADSKQQTSVKERRSVLEEVVVTARRTEENLQDVPVAISTINSDDLRREQINSPQDLQGRVPSLVVGTGSQMRNTETPTIRGQGAQFGSSPGVVMYMAEVALPSDPVANYQGGAGKFFDLSNIQVLKGSQGTLFGRNTTGGALLLEPHKPENNLSFRLAAGVSYLEDVGSAKPSGESYEAVLNLPIIDEKLAARIGGQVYKRDGFTRDVITNKDYDDKNYWTARVGLLWNPNDRFENYFMGVYSKSDDNGTATVIEEINREGLNQAIPAAAGLGLVSNLIPGLDLAQPLNLGCLILNTFGPSSNCGQDIVDEQGARGNRSVQLSGDPQDVLKSSTVLDKFSFDINDNLTLRNIASYSTLVHSYRWDLDGSRAQLNEFINPEDVNNADVSTYTEELQLQGEALDKALSYVVGAYYEKTDAKGRIIAKSLLFVDVNQEYEQEKESYAPFFQGNLDLGYFTDSLAGLNLTLGVRYTVDKTFGRASIQQLAAGLIPLVDKSFTTRIRNTAITYTAGLDYKINENLIYGKISRGYKTGGVATIAVNPANYTYEPEYVTNYEIGQKSDFTLGEIPLRLNTALYYTDYADLQKAAPDSFVDPANPSPVPQLGQAVFNVGKAWVAGFEMDLTAQILPSLMLVATYGYTKAEYEEYDLLYGGATAQLDCSGEAKERGNVLDLSCLPFQTTPEHQYSISARSFLMGSDEYGDIEASLTYTFVDEQYSAQLSPPEGEPGAWLPSFGLVNASVTWNRFFGSALSLQLYGSNLANKEYRISNSNQWNLTYFRSSIYSEPRVLGMQLSYDWQ
ncbi:TonB-dependent receptor [Zhongshania aquimaris]|uniref:TonB-dependent receptor n=1 Tax=Zhongshania aquimaris TaxID=2857107 RepID=A0ABS6VVZ5_9GAMM|nr:TonB-dependent receptor [Zhongshania aquimaris]